MDFFILFLRVIHILAGVFWVGAALMMFYFIGPAAKAAGTAGLEFTQKLISKTAISSKIYSAAGLTVLAGAILYWLDSDGFSSSWQSSGPGIGFALGGAAALFGFIVGIFVGRNNKALGRLAGEIKGQPSREQIEKMESIQKMLAWLAPLNVVFLIIATLLMASARYLVF